MDTMCHIRAADIHVGDLLFRTSSVMGGEKVSKVIVDPDKDQVVVLTLNDSASAIYKKDDIVQVLVTE